MNGNEIRVNFSYADKILILTIEGSIKQVRHIMIEHKEAILKIFHLKYNQYELPEDLFEKFRNGQDLPKRLDVNPVIYARVDPLQDSPGDIQVIIHGDPHHVYLRMLDTKLLWEGLNDLLQDKKL